MQLLGGAVLCVWCSSKPSGSCAQPLCNAAARGAGRLVRPHASQQRVNKPIQCNCWAVWCMRCNRCTLCDEAGLGQPPRCGLGNMSSSCCSWLISAHVLRRHTSGVQRIRLMPMLQLLRELSWCMCSAAVTHVTRQRTPGAHDLL
jgi:hypothetical protein